MNGSPPLPPARPAGEGGETTESSSFRDTWVTLALTAGVPLELVQKVTGHKTTEIVLRKGLRLSQKQASICDNEDLMNSTQTIDESILRSIRASRSASVFSAKHFEGVGQAAAVRQALSRLARAGKIRRIRQGWYDLPRKHPLIGQTAPDPMATVRALMGSVLTGVCHSPFSL